MWRFWSIWQWIQSIGDGGGGGLGFMCWSFEVGGGISQLGFSSEWVVVYSGDLGLFGDFVEPLERGFIVQLRWAGFIGDSHSTLC